ncbi:MAG: M20/M25/M40 family metallo-hydrolase [Sphingomonadaceae bacterium]
MKRMLLAPIALALLAFSAPAAAEIADAEVVEMRDRALADDLAWEIVEGLVTEVGPRLAGTEAEARARDWMVARLNALGFSNVRVEEFMMPVWVRGAEEAEILAPFPQKFHVAALGRSAATPAEGITAEVAAFDSVAALAAAPEGSLAGKIAYVTHHMARTQDGSGYGFAGPTRWIAPSLAAARGAVAAVVRSVGTDWHRNPHTGGTTWAEGVAPIPAGALSNPDADTLERMFERAGGRPVTMRLLLTPRWIGERASGNVIAEVPGSDRQAGEILIGGHLDSWDLSPGAFDNAAGVAITTAAAKNVMDQGTPKRTIRLVLFGAEEVGLFGGRDYRERHRDENIVFVSEADFGADRVWRIENGLAEANRPLFERVAAAVAPLGIARAQNRAGAGADLGAWARGGVAAIDLAQSGLRYFDLHHTPDDTLDKIDPAQLQQNVAAWTAMLAIVANAGEDILPVPAEEE